MSKSYKQITGDISASMRKLSNEHPDMMKAFSSMNAAAIRDGALDVKTKELVALGIGIAKLCDGCIGFHTKKLIELGCTREQFVELLSVVVYMGGGPSLMYAANALDAFDEFSAK